MLARDRALVLARERVLVLAWEPALVLARGRVLVLAWELVPALIPRPIQVLHLVLARESAQAADARLLDWSPE